MQSYPCLASCLIIEGTIPAEDLPDGYFIGHDSLFIPLEPWENLHDVIAIKTEFEQIFNLKLGLVEFGVDRPVDPPQSPRVLARQSIFASLFE